MAFSQIEEQNQECIQLSTRQKTNRYRDLACQTDLQMLHAYITI